MSGQQQKGGLPKEGQVAGGFGFVTVEDRQKWEQARQLQQRPESAAKAFVKGFMSGVTEYRSKLIDARLRAEQQEAVKEEHEATQAKTTRRTVKDAETVDIEQRDLRDQLDPGFEF